MSNENLASTRAAEAPSEEELIRERDAEAKQLRERVETLARLKNEAQREEDEALRGIRAKLFGEGEAGVIKGRFATAIPQEAITHVQTELSKRSGVLTEGNVDRTMTDVRGMELSGPELDSRPDFSLAEDHVQEFEQAPSNAVRTRRREVLQRLAQLHDDAELSRDVMGAFEPEKPTNHPPRKLTDLGPANPAP